MPTTSPNEAMIASALINLQTATMHCDKDDLKTLWRRGLLPAEIYSWLRRAHKLPEPTPIPQPPTQGHSA